MADFLLIVAGAEAGKRVDIGPTPFISRSPDNDLGLQNPLVSRKHARVFRRSEAKSIADFNSSHGAFVKGERIAKRELVSGEIVLVGPGKNPDLRS